MGLEAMGLEEIKRLEAAARKGTTARKSWSKLKEAKEPNRIDTGRDQFDTASFKPTCFEATSVGATSESVDDAAREPVDEPVDKGGRHGMAGSWLIATAAKGATAAAGGSDTSLEERS